jgi:hypothetical protein
VRPGAVAEEALKRVRNGVIGFTDQDDGSCKGGMDADDVREEVEVIKTDQDTRTTAVNISKTIADLSPEAEFFAGGIYPSSMDSLRVRINLAGQDEGGVPVLFYRLLQIGRWRRPLPGRGSPPRLESNTVLPP